VSSFQLFKKHNVFNAKLDYELLIPSGILGPLELLRIKELYFFETSEITHPTTQNIPKDLKPHD
jgi:hypothetical protein